MISLLPTFQVQYARASALWQLLDMIVYKEGVFAKVHNRLSTTFWGDHQRFFKSMLVAAKVPAVAAEARDAISGGYSVVVGLQSTGAANMESEMETQHAPQGAHAPGSHGVARAVCYGTFTVCRAWQARHTARAETTRGCISLGSCMGASVASRAGCVRRVYGQGGGAFMGV